MFYHMAFVNQKMQDSGFVYMNHTNKEASSFIYYFENWQKTFKMKHNKGLLFMHYGRDSSGGPATATVIMNGHGEV